MTISWEREKERWAASPNPALNQRNANQPPSSHRIFFVQPPSDGDQGEEEKLDTSKECGVSHLVFFYHQSYGEIPSTDHQLRQLEDCRPHFPFLD